MKVGTDALVLGSLIETRDKDRCLDVGAGTGVISLILAQRFPNLIIDAVEKDVPSSDECRENFQNSAWRGRLEVYNVDFLDFSINNKYNLIVSNPPYYASTLKNEDVRKANARHAESLPPSLFFKKATDLLLPEGEFWIIVPSDDIENWLNIANDNGLLPFQIVDVYGKIGVLKRNVIGLKRNAKSCMRNAFTIRNEAGQYSDQYILQTKELHFNKLN